jgi:hypothetical protein
MRGVGGLELFSTIAIKLFLTIISHYHKTLFMFVVSSRAT